MSYIRYISDKQILTYTMITRIQFETERLGNYMEFVPYITTMDELYTAESLYEGYDPDNEESFANCYDQQVYNYYLETGKRPKSPLEMIARSIHDFNMSQQINVFLERYEKKKVVAVMGGNAMKRTDEAYRKIVLLSKALTESGSLMVSGGGSGAMEATALGALMACRSMEEVDDALRMMSVAPCPGSKGYLKTAFRVLERYPHIEGYECLTIPTWLYGHEPTNPFATRIAKYFDNSIREDMLLTISFGGIIFTPGSAGTMQEVFQEAVQNHYLVHDFASPMVFLDKNFWTKDVPVYNLLDFLTKTGKYKNLLLSITDEPREAVEEIIRFQHG